MSRPLLMLNGPNLNPLGRRGPEISGRLPAPQAAARLLGDAADAGGGRDDDDADHHAQA
jgi:3-dehydroquinate dehydratase